MIKSHNVKLNCDQEFAASVKEYARLRGWSVSQLVRVALVSWMSQNAPTPSPTDFLRVDGEPWMLDLADGIDRIGRHEN